jgi:hypothetical protein
MRTVGAPIPPRLISALVLVGTVLAVGGGGLEAATLFDNYNRADLNAGAPTTYTVTVTAGDGGASISGSSYLLVTNDATGGANANGRVFVTAPTSSLPINSTLSSNSGIVEWTFNMKYNRTTNPAGFQSGSYGVAVALGATSSDLMAANGYAVVYGNTGTPDPIRLVKFAGGLDLDVNITTLCSSGVSDIAAVTNYASVRVTYEPATNYWKLYVRDDGASAWGDPNDGGVTVQKGSTATDNTYTGAALPNWGYFWNYSTAANTTSQFDNYSVSAASLLAPDLTGINNTAADVDPCAASGIQVTWPQDAANWNDSGSSGRKYDVLRGGSAIQSGITYGTTTYTDTTCVAGTPYTYTVRYINSNAQSATTTGASATDAAGNAPSLTGINNTAADIDACAATGVRITWPQDAAAWNDAGPTGRSYSVLRGGTPIQTGIAYGTTTYTDGAPTPGGLYTVQYTNGCSQSATTTGASATDGAGGVAPDLTGINNTATDLAACLATGIQVSWPQDPAAWNDLGPTGRSYDVLRGGTPIQSSITYGTTTYTDSAPTPGGLYTVRYNNGCSGTATTSGASATDATNDATAPILSAFGEVPAKTSFTATWTTDEGATSELHWGTTLGGPYPDSTTSGTLVTSHSLTASSLASGTTYYFVVCSVDLCGNTTGNCSVERSVATLSRCDVGTNTPIFINEFHYDDASIDENEGVEIAGPAGTDLTGWSVILYNGGNGASYYTLSLSGTIPDLQAGRGVLWFAVPASPGMQNGPPDGLALVNPSNVVIQFLSYEGSFVATNGPALGMTSVNIGVSENGSEVGMSLQLMGAGIVYEDFAWTSALCPSSNPRAATAGAVNSLQALSCTAVDFSLWQIEQNVGAAPDNTFKLPCGTVLFPGDYVVVARGTSGPPVAPTQAEFETFWGITFGSNVHYLNNEGRTSYPPLLNGPAEFALLDAGGSTRDGVTPQLDLLGKTQQRLSPAADATLAPSWREDLDSSFDSNPGSGMWGAGTGKLVLSEMSDATGTGFPPYEFVELYFDTAATTCGAPNLSGPVTATDLDSCGGSGIQVSWGDVTAWGDGAGGPGRAIAVYRSEDGRSWTLAGVDPDSLSPFVDTGATAEVAYYYKVVATNDCSRPTWLRSASTKIDHGGAVDVYSTAVTVTDLNPCADGGVSVTWPKDPRAWGDDGPTSARSYTVLRDEVPVASGPCSGSFPYDNDVQTCFDDTGTNGVAYVYKVRYHNACTHYATTAGTSGSDQIAAPPVFAGLYSATAPSGAGCAIDLAWASATPVCGTSVVYNVYRSTTLGFPPGPTNRILTGYTGTSWRDLDVVAGTTYYYVVRAEDNNPGGGPNGGVEETNTFELSKTCGSVGLTLDISGWKIRQHFDSPNNAKTEGDFTFPAGTVLSTGDVVILARLSEKAAFETYYGITLPANVRYFNGNVPSTADVPPVINEDDDWWEILDLAAAQHDGPTPYDPAAYEPCPPGCAVEMNKFAANWSRNGVSVDPSLLANWTYAPESGATPGTVGLVPTASGKLVISEVADSYYRYEYLELYYDGTTGPCTPVTEVSPTGAVRPFLLRRDPAACGTTSTCLFFQPMTGAAAYNIANGTTGTWYSHSCLATGRYPGDTEGTVLCASGACGAELDGWIRTPVPFSDGDLYYLVTAYAGVVEGVSGYDSDGKEIDRSRSSCAP